MPLTNICLCVVLNEFSQLKVPCNYGHLQKKNEEKGSESVLGRDTNSKRELISVAVYTGRVCHCGPREWM